MNYPTPDTHCWDDENKTDCWSYSDEVVRPIVAKVAALEAENLALRKVISGVVPRLQSACGRTAMPPVMMQYWLEQQLAPEQFVLMLQSDADITGVPV